MPADPNSERSKAKAAGIPWKTWTYRLKKGLDPTLPIKHPNSSRSEAKAAGIPRETYRERKMTGRDPYTGKRDTDLRKCLKVIDRRKAAGEDLSYNAIATEAQTSVTPVRRALEIRRTEERLAEEKQYLLTANQQERLQQALTAHKKSLERDFDQRVHDKAVELLDKNLLRYLEEREREIKRWDKAWSNRGIFTKAEHQLLLKCLHPDHVYDAQRQNEAFRLIRENQQFLIKDEPRPPSGMTMPKTFAEMMARRK